MIMSGQLSLSICFLVIIMKHFLTMRNGNNYTSCFCEQYQICIRIIFNKRFVVFVSLLCMQIINKYIRAVIRTKTVKPLAVSWNWRTSQLLDIRVHRFHMFTVVWLKITTSKNTNMSHNRTFLWRTIGSHTGKIKGRIEMYNWAVRQRFWSHQQ